LGEKCQKQTVNGDKKKPPIETSCEGAVGWEKGKTGKATATQKQRGSYWVKGGKEICKKRKSEKNTNWTKMTGVEGVIGDTKNVKGGNGPRWERGKQA